MNFPADSHSGGDEVRAASRLLQRQVALTQHVIVGHRRATAVNAPMHSNNPINRQAAGNTFSLENLNPAWTREQWTATVLSVQGQVFRERISN